MISAHRVTIRGFISAYLLFALAAILPPHGALASNAPTAPQTPDIGQPSDISLPSSIEHNQAMPASASRVVSTTGAREIDNIFAAVQDRFDVARGAASTPTGGEVAPNAQTTNNPTQSTSALLGRMLMSLALVILLGLGIAWAAKRFLLKRNLLGSEYIEVLGSFAISQKSILHLVRVGEQHLLIGEGAGSLSLITSIQPPEQKSFAYASASDREELDSKSAAPTNNGIDEETITSFKDRLSEWQKSLDGQHLSQEVKTSLLLLSGLSERLRRKKEQGNG